MTAEDFLAWDERESVRREFVAGDVYEVHAMAGAEEPHVTLAGNIYGALRRHLRGTSCRAYIADMKLRVEAADAIFYPDVFVSCSAADHGNPKFKRDAVLVVEVLSPGTAAYDRGDKFTTYRLLDSLQEVLFADPASRRCDLYRKGADGLWVLHPTEPEAGVALASVDLAISAADLWAEVPLVER